MVRHSALREPARQEKPARQDQPARQEAPADPRGPSYEADVYSWAMAQARLIRESRWGEIDAENVAEEIESLGRSERRELRSYLARIIQHMLKWDHQPEKRTPSWATSIRVHRLHAERQIRDNPGLKPQLGALLEDAYATAMLQAADETGLDLLDFPRSCSYGLEEVMTREIAPHPNC